MSQKDKDEQMNDAIEDALKLYNEALQEIQKEHIQLIEQLKKELKENART